MGKQRQGRRRRRSAGERAREREREREREGERGRAGEWMESHPHTRTPPHTQPNTHSLTHSPTHSLTRRRRRRRPWTQRGEAERNRERCPGAGALVVCVGDTVLDTLSDRGKDILAPSPAHRAAGGLRPNHIRGRALNVYAPRAPRPARCRRGQVVLLRTPKSGGYFSAPPRRALPWRFLVGCWCADAGPSARGRVRGCECAGPSARVRKCECAHASARVRRRECADPSAQVRVRECASPSAQVRVRREPPWVVLSQIPKMTHKNLTTSKRRPPWRFSTH